MKITEIKIIGRGDRYKVFIDDKFDGIFEAEFLAKSKLRVGQELTEEGLTALKIQNGDLACFERSLSVLEKSMKSEKMLKDYLLGKDYPEECIERAIEKLKDYGYINDEAFAENFIRTYSSSKGRKKLKYDLLGKGIDSEIIEDKLQLLSDEEQDETCLKFALKYMKNKELDQKTKQKLYNHLLSKGFDYGTISRAIAEVQNDRN